MGFRATQRRQRRFAASVFAVVAMTTATTASTAAAEPPVQEQLKMSVRFASPTIRIAGPGALVYVKCKGTVSSTCVGTLAIDAPGGTREAPFSIERGEKRMVVVPLGSERDLFEGIESARAVADTMQVRGSSVRTARMLRIS